MPAQNSISALPDIVTRLLLVIIPEVSKLKNLYRNSCLSLKEVFRKLSVQNTGWTGPDKYLDCLDLISLS